MNLTKIVDTLTSYADGEYRVLRETGWTLPFLTERMLDEGVEKCPSCKWWAEAWEMIPTDADEPDGKCSNCRFGDGL